jgi:hypothetical protein
VVPIAVSSKVYGPALLSLWNAELDWDTNVFKALLTTSAYTPSQDTHRYKSDVTNEVTGTGYTAGGVTLASKTIAYDGPSNTLTLDCADPAWPTSTLTARYLVVYKDTGTAATSPLVCYVDFGEDRSTGATTFTYVVPSTGIAQFLAA